MERGIDVLGHPLGVTADIEVTALLQPAPETLFLLEHFVLDVDLFSLVAGKRGVEADAPVCLEFEPIIGVVKVGGAVPLAKEEPVEAGGLGGESLLEEGSEGGNACAGADEDDGGGLVRESEVVRGLYVDRDGGRFDGGLLAEKVAADAGVGAAVDGVVRDDDGEVDLVGEDAG